MWGIDRQYGELWGWLLVLPVLSLGQWGVLRQLWPSSQCWIALTLVGGLGGTATMVAIAALTGWLSHSSIGSVALLLLLTTALGGILSALQMALMARWLIVPILWVPVSVLGLALGTLLMTYLATVMRLPTAVGLSGAITQGVMTGLVGLVYGIATGIVILKSARLRRFY